MAMRAAEKHERDPGAEDERNRRLGNGQERSERAVPSVEIVNQSGEVFISGGIRVVVNLHVEIEDAAQGVGAESAEVEHADVEGIGRGASEAERVAGIDLEDSDREVGRQGRRAHPVRTEIERGAAGEIEEMIGGRRSVGEEERGVGEVEEAAVGGLQREVAPDDEEIAVAPLQRARGGDGEVGGEGVGRRVGDIDPRDDQVAAPGDGAVHDADFARVGGDPLHIRVEGVRHEHRAA